MFDYTVYPNYDVEEFINACEKISRCFPKFMKAQPLIDVDGSVVQMFKNKKDEINVYNDIEVGAVYIKSNVSLSPVF
ncbi:MAG: hypothetical protein FWG70_04115 [Oscillospiraceae bacterium]|nr:hypothetical protein [Oscillospiraceae bacterium]